MSKFAPHARRANNPRATASTVCQKCLGNGHFTYECKAPARPYVSRPSRTAQLANPSLRAKTAAKVEALAITLPSASGTADKILADKEKERRKKAEDGSSSSSSSSSSGGSDSGSDSDSDSGSSSSGSRSGSEKGARRRRRSPSAERSRKRARRSASRSSSGSGSGSESERD